MSISNRPDARGFPRLSRTCSPATEVGNGLPVWARRVVRCASTCLFVAVFLAVIGRLHRPIDWKCALSNTPLRPETQICGMLGESPIVAMPGLPLRVFGIDIRQSGQNRPGHWVGDWLGDFLGGSIGDLIYGEAVAIELPYSEFTDVQMPLIAQAPALRNLALDGTRITDDGLAHLIGLKNLETLSISDNDITDRGARLLGRMMSLKHLDLRGTRVTGAAIESLAALPRLESLNLSRTTLDAEQLANLRLLVNLRTLSLDGVSLGDEGVTVLGELASLRRLQMRGTRVTAAGVARLAALIPLETCAIEGVSFSRSDLDALRAESER